MFNGLDELEDFAERLAPPTKEELEAARSEKLAEAYEENEAPSELEVHA
ncbi:hypothetical protein [Marinobacterium mangrovicola]|uniref:Uncharacterized protein n=1 Tax=Marinobacterium mangrovicola TaxID=1476959 RepID=A0A4V2PEF9_9GAMM|nr:hypothetical protein [Marinobacterium mangrovicola]TCK08976.1 hypothetical protein CLV83_1072 [Marinobacterium mangrovicola]